MEAKCLTYHAPGNNPSGIVMFTARLLEHAVVIRETTGKCVAKGKSGGEQRSRPKDNWLPDRCGNYGCEVTRSRHYRLCRRIGATLPGERLCREFGSSLQTL